MYSTDVYNTYLYWGSLAALFCASRKPGGILRVGAGFI